MERPHGRVCDVRLHLYDTKTRLASNGRLDRRAPAASLRTSSTLMLARRATYRPGAGVPADDPQSEVTQHLRVARCPFSRQAVAYTATAGDMLVRAAGQELTRTSPRCDIQR